ncbi:RagB/SusD family nutrient uptake outer membrane protein [Saccharicrinis aurantiacus]|uniref:RagB/SusD family nutrient uptake outer membrane protein n=1 Tax=Saccharicrinis aurantiacus TaxID=1849719 RepID=UPI002490EB06|nr:RagB/SusD family nutrient uptake outer membrane protein [Saccharicrinis aurantiacus]
MKLQTFKYIAFASVVLMFSSCTDWLDEVNPNQSDKDNYWQNLNQTNSTLSAAYAALASDFALNIVEEAPRSDMATPGFGRPNYPGKGSVWYYHSYTNSHISIIKKWEILYLGIFRSNQVISALENLENISSQEQWDSQMAQARFLRGLYHFYIHSAFNKGDIIIKDIVPGSLEEYNQGLSKSEDVIKFFREDLQYAFDNLPLSYDKTNQGRATKGAAATILGTSYLYEATLANPGGEPNAELIQKAVEMFEFVESSNQYELVEDLNLLFTTAGEMNKESILEIAFSNAYNTEYNTWGEDGLHTRLAFSFNGKGSNDNHVFPSLWMIDAYHNEEMDLNDDRNKVTAQIYTPVPGGEPDIEDIEITRKVSRRASAMMGMVQDDYTPYYTEVFHKAYSFPGESKKTQNGFGRYKHYNNHDILADETDLPGGVQRSGKNVVVNRLADLKLMLAECYIYQNKIGEAIAEINDIRRRWALIQLDVADYDQASLLSRLQNLEKPLETSIEGHCIRWFDLRRWGMLESNFKMHAQEKFYTQNYEVEYGEINGDAVKKWSTISRVSDPSNPDEVLVTDYEKAAENFIYDRHAWLPIPSTEEQSNTEL